MSQQPQPAKSPTTSQLFLIHSLEVLGAGAVFTAVVTVYSAFQAGNFSLSSIGVTLISVVTAFLSKGLSGLLTNASTLQAIEDIFKRNQQAAAQAQPQVIVHNYIPAQPPAPQQVQPASQPVQTPAPRQFQPQAWQTITGLTAAVSSQQTQ